MVEVVQVPPHPQQEPKHYTAFNNFNWKSGTKDDAVLFALATGYPEMGMSNNEVSLLYDCLEKCHPKHIVELGRRYGTSNRMFLQYVLRNGGTLESWDNDQHGILPESYLGMELPFVQQGNDWICQPNPETKIWLRVAESQRSPVVPTCRFVDFLLIDTLHDIEHALGEYMRWRNYLNSGAMIAFHDSNYPPVNRSIEIAKEVEAQAEKVTYVKEYVNSESDGYGLKVLEWGQVVK
jgi:hypothetical protein